MEIGPNRRDKGEDLMAVRINPYLVLNGNAEEAIKFYAEALGGTIHGIIKFGDNPFPGMPEEVKDRVMHAHLTIGDSALMFSDTYPGQEYTIGNQVTVTLQVDSVAAASASTPPWPRARRRSRCRSRRRTGAPPTPR
jgi:PhnB protein